MVLISSSRVARLMREGQGPVSFLETIESVRAFLERNGRVSLRVLKREFELDDEALDELVEELVDVQQVAARKGKVLSWAIPVPSRTVAEEPETQAAPTPTPQLSAPPQVAEGEHRQLTVMFCDLVGSTELSERLDAEALSEVVAAYQKTCAASVESFDGHIAQYLGDGVLVYFGYPLAHEDDAMRAIHAALRIAGEVPGLNSRLVEEHAALREHPLQIRVGIHTGPVVVGELGGGEKRERLALGDTVNIAARIEGEAEPGSIRRERRDAAPGGGARSSSWSLASVRSRESKGRSPSFALSKRQVFRVGSRWPAPRGLHRWSAASSRSDSCSSAGRRPWRDTARWSCCQARRGWASRV